MKGGIVTRKPRIFTDSTEEGAADTRRLDRVSLRGIFYRTRMRLICWKPVWAGDMFVEKNILTISKLTSLGGWYVCSK